MAINSLSTADATLASQIPFADPTSGQDRKTSLSQIASLLQANAAGPLVTQYAAPGSSGFTVTVSPPVRGTGMFLLLTPAAAYAAGAIALPAQTSLVDGQEFLVFSTQAVSTLSVTCSGASILGAPAGIATNGFFRLRYDGVFKNLYRVG